MDTIKGKKYSYIKKGTILLFVGACWLNGACSKNAATVMDSAPTVFVYDASVYDAATSSDLVLKVKLDKASATPVSVSFATQDYTAVAGTEYVSKSGVLTFPANTTDQEIHIAIPGYPYRRPNKEFLVLLTAPVGMTLGNTKATALIQSSGKLISPDNMDSAGYKTPDHYAGFKSAWSDEFNGTAIDTSSWSYDTGGGGWGNHELEYYTISPNNSYISNGNLVIEARREGPAGNYNYTSARMLTKGKKSFTYGRVDVRAKIPSGKGIWPAIWGLGANIDKVNWPACGETDIMEVVGRDPAKLYGTLHFANATGAHAQNGGTYINNEEFAKVYHVYSIDWTSDKIDFYVDDILFFSSPTNVAANGAFNLPTFFILNVAVGGDFGGPVDDALVFPKRMNVDYIRVFSKQ